MQNTTALATSLKLGSAQNGIECQACSWGGCGGFVVLRGFAGVGGDASLTPASAREDPDEAFGERLWKRLEEELSLMCCEQTFGDRVCLGGMVRLQ